MVKNQILSFLTLGKGKMARTVSSSLISNEFLVSQWLRKINQKCTDWEGRDKTAFICLSMK